MKYIRTKDGHRFIRVANKVYDLEHLPNGLWFDGENLKDDNDYDSANIYTNCFEKQADTIEELIMIGDLVFKTTGEIYEIPNQFYIDCYIKQKCIQTLFIKDNKGNYIRVAEKNDKGELELL